MNLVDALFVRRGKNGKDGVVEGRDGGGKRTRQRTMAGEGGGGRERGNGGTN